MYYDCPTMGQSGIFQTASCIPLVDCEIILKGHTTFSPQFFIVKNLNFCTLIFTLINIQPYLLYPYFCVYYFFISYLKISFRHVGILPLNTSACILNKDILLHNHSNIITPKKLNNLSILANIRSTLKIFDLPPNHHLYLQLVLQTKTQAKFSFISQLYLLRLLKFNIVFSTLFFSLGIDSLRRLGYLSLEWCTFWVCLCLCGII